MPLRRRSGVATCLRCGAGRTQKLKRGAAVAPLQPGQEIMIRRISGYEILCADLDKSQTLLYKTPPATQD